MTEVCTEVCSGNYKHRHSHDIGSPRNNNVTNPRNVNGTTGTSRDDRLKECRHGGRTGGQDAAGGAGVADAPPPPPHSDAADAADVTAGMAKATPPEVRMIV